MLGTSVELLLSTVSMSASLCENRISCVEKMLFQSFLERTARGLFPVDMLGKKINYVTYVSLV